MTKLTKDQKIAFAAFLECEKKRHMEDIMMINDKLAILRVQGIEAKEAAPWVEEKDLWEDPAKPDPWAMTQINESPLGGYWRYRLDNAFENVTGEDAE
jgi:hypothetical protein